MGNGPIFNENIIKDIQEEYKRFEMAKRRGPMRMVRKKQSLFKKLWRKAFPANGGFISPEYIEKRRKEGKLLVGDRKVNEYGMPVFNVNIPMPKCNPPKED